jgi:ADP-ribosylglycohydrolase
MLGAIIGDTVGSIYEFNNTKDYNFTLFDSESGYTDDSIMSMAVAYWLLKDPKHRYETLEKIMVDFGEHCPCPMGGYGGGFYRWLFCPNELYVYDETMGELPYHSPTGRHPYGSWGNGSAMRCSACGWFFDTLEETERVAGISAKITHNHPEGIKGAQATAAAIWMARNGKTKIEIREYIESEYGYDLSGTWEEYNRTYHWEDGCQGTVPPAIVCFLESYNFEDAIRRAVSIGGDSDTLACITGGIAEAYYGIIPEDMIERARKPFPKVFDNILKEMKETTAYGRVVPNKEISERTDIVKPVMGIFPTNLDKFIEYHNKDYRTALSEIKSGKKSSHWIWYIFPQMKGLGHSAFANHFGISGINEAAAFYADRTLGKHLREITEALLALPETDINMIIPGIDSLKLKSSMTLFDVICPNDIFAKVIQKYFHGDRDTLTLSMLGLPNA